MNLTLLIENNASTVSTFVCKHYIFLNILENNQEKKHHHHQVFTTLTTTQHRATYLKLIFPAGWTPLPFLQCVWALLESTPYTAATGLCHLLQIFLSCILVPRLSLSSLSLLAPLSAQQIFFWGSTIFHASSTVMAQKTFSKNMISVTLE